jgi:hypothetical protein
MNEEELAMSSIVQFDGENGIEILIDTSTGESFCSVRGYARMADKAVSTISERLKGVRIEDEKMAETSTPGGLQGVRLITENNIVEWLPKDNPTAASALLRLGVRMGLHKMAGYEVSTTATQLPRDQTKTSNFSLADLKKMNEQVRLMTRLEKTKQKKLAHAILNELEIQWGVEPTAYESPSDLPASSSTNTDFDHDWNWFLDSQAPGTPWHAPSGKKIPITNLYNSYSEYCFRRNITPPMRKVFSKCLASLGAERIESNFIYWVLPNRPE